MSKSIKDQASSEEAATGRTATGQTATGPAATGRTAIPQTQADQPPSRRDFLKSSRTIYDRSLSKSKRQKMLALNDSLC